jgi:hypothetical protein
MVMTYRYIVSLCSARLDKIKQYDSIYGNDRQGIHQRRGARSGCVVIPSQYSTIVHHAEPEILRQVLIAIFWG